MLLHKLLQACVEFGNNPPWLGTAFSCDLAEFSDPKCVQKVINNTAVPRFAKLWP